MQSPTTTITAAIQNLNLTPNFLPKFPPNPLRILPEFVNHRSTASMASTFGRFKVNSKLDNSSGEFLTITEYAGKGGANVGDDLVVLFSHLEYAFKRIAALVASPVNSSLGKSSGGSQDVDAGRDKPKPLDIVSVRRLIISVCIFRSRMCKLLGGFVFLKSPSLMICFFLIFPE